MAEIVGTITNLSDFLSKTQVCLSVKPNDPQQQIICLEADRKYTLLSEDGIKTLNAYALKGYRLITDYPLFDKPTSREEFLDAFNVAMRFYEKKDS